MIRICVPLPFPTWLSKLGRPIARHNLFYTLSPRALRLNIDRGNAVPVRAYALQQWGPSNIFAAMVILRARTADCGEACSQGEEIPTGDQWCRSQAER